MCSVGWNSFSLNCKYVFVTVKSNVLQIIMKTVNLK